jgi:hypothetical protein
MMITIGDKIFRLKHTEKHQTRTAVKNQLQC